MRKWIALTAALAGVGAPAAACQAMPNIPAFSHRYDIGDWRVTCVQARALFDECEARGRVAAARVTLTATQYGVNLEMSGCGIRPRPPLEEMFWPRDEFQIAPVLDRLEQELRLGIGACRTARLAGSERETLSDLILLLFAATGQAAR